jgi:hypothetical protein
MATYKMIQDIEAEDHIIGPLSLRQFIFALISAFLLYINFLCLTKHVGFLLIVFLPPALFTGFFAFPFGGDQPTEVWALAKIRFLFKPRKRIWDQSGVKELVTITVPKKIERNLTNGLSQNEVKSRLSALANTIDSRGWAVKNVNINLYANPGSVEEVSDRLVDISSLPREVPNYDVQAADDIMDERSNPIAQQFEHMIEASSQAHHQQLINQMNAAAPAQSAAPSLAAPTAPADYWFLNQNPQPVALPADQAVFNSPSVIAPGAVTSPLQPVAASAATDLSEEAFLAKVRTDEANEQITNSHLHTLQPLGSQPMSRTPVAASAPAPPPVYVPATPSPEPVDTAILSLARNNDLSIATLARESAREAQKSKHDESTDGEVVISLR